MFQVVQLGDVLSLEVNLPVLKGGILRERAGIRWMGDFSAEVSILSALFLHLQRLAVIAV